MRSIRWLLAVVCFIARVPGRLGVMPGMGVGSLIHVLSILAVIAIRYNIISGKKPV